MGVFAGVNSGTDYWGRPADGGGTALIADNEIVCAIAEERLSRSPHAGGFALSLPNLLARFGLARGDVDRYCLSYYAHPFVPNNRIHDKHLRELEVSDLQKVTVLPSHHLSHAYSAFFLSPFEEALIIVADNEGTILHPLGAEECADRGDCRFERNSYYWGRGNELSLLHRDLDGPNELGFGRMYGRFTRYIGFNSYHDAGKVMGLSAYGRISSAMPDLWSINDNGKLSCNINDTRSLADLSEFFSRSGFEDPGPGGPRSYLERPYRDLAAYVQQQLCRWGAIKVSRLVQLTGIKNICISGGVGLNSILNSHLEETLNVRLFVPPYPSDEGQALGNAIFGLLQSEHRKKQKIIRFTDFAYLGPEYSDAEIRVAVEEFLRSGRWQKLSGDATLELTASLLADGQIVGWFQGRSEYGARALGNRSILADPRTRGLQESLNALKGRELFRPFAPSVLDGHAAEYFDGTVSGLYDHMLGVASVKADQRIAIAGVVHVDGTSRPQVVKQAVNPRFHDLIQRFATKTGIPMLLNTSFNRANEPIVETPHDALHSADAMGLDAIVMNDTLLRRCDDKDARTPATSFPRARHA